MIVLIFIVFLLGFVLSYLFAGKRKGEEGRFVSNLIIVKDTGVCQNDCVHIHHWMWMIGLLFVYLVVNLIIGFPWNNNYYYLISFVMGASFAEYVQFKNDIFQIQQKCFPVCKVDKV